MGGGGAFADFVDFPDGFHGNTSDIFISTVSIANFKKNYNAFSELFRRIPKGLQTQLSCQLEQSVGKHLLQTFSGGQGDSGVEKNQGRLKLQSNLFHRHLQRNRTTEKLCSILCKYLTCVIQYKIRDYRFFPRIWGGDLAKRGSYYGKR
jgi:hypothetical protein